jgi:thiosulfate reductase/polysulfide reductase chain A
MEKTENVEITISRRDFLKLSAMLGGAAALGLSGSRVVDALAASQPATQASTEKLVYTTCAVCSGGCAEIAHVKDDRLMYLTGNPDDQIARGRLCVKGYAGRQLLYDPDRLKYPMKRTNPEKGIDVDPKWVRITWDEALDITAKKFNEIKQKYGPQAIVFVMRPNDFAARLANAIGTPNYITHMNTCYSTHAVVWKATVTGTDRPWSYDIENAKYILSFGWDGPGKAKNMQSQHFINAKTNGARIVVLDPRQSITAALANEWIPIKPGTDLAFALAMINVIVNEELYDKEFVSKYCSGFDKLKSFIQEYTPEWAEKITEVPASTIRRIAREFATTRPAVVPTHKRDAAGPNYANSWRLAHAIVILNALVGSIDRRGGYILPRSFAFPKFEEAFPAPPYPPKVKERIDGREKFPITNAANKGSFTTLIEGILSGKPYEVKAALVQKYNLLSFPNPKRALEAFKKLEFMAVIDVLPVEMVQLADVVLPEHCYLEATAVVPRTYFALYPQIAIRQPVVKPLYDTKGFGAIIPELAKKMGLGNYFEGVSSTAWFEKQLNAVGYTFDQLKKSPNGLLGDPVPFVPKESFGTPSKKIELYSTVLEKYGYDPLPAWKPKRDQPTTEYPYYLIIYRPPQNIMTQTQNNPLLTEIWGENKALINTTTAKKLGIRDGEYVFVESKVGKIKVKAKVTEGIRPDCIAIDHGFGHWSKEIKNAYGRGSCDGDLIPITTIDELLALKDPAMSAMMEDVCVKVYK